MNMFWNLDAMYPSLDSPEISADLSTAKELILDIKRQNEEDFKNTDNAALKITNFLKRLNTLYSIVSKPYQFAHLCFSTNTNNQAAIKLIETGEKLLPEIILLETSFKQWLVQIEALDNIIETEPYLKEHAFILSEYINAAKHMLSESEEGLIANLQNTGSSAWRKLFDKLTSSVAVDITLDGEIKSVPLSIARDYAYHESASVRKAAYDAELKSYEKIDTALAAALNGIKGEVLTIIDKRRYATPLDMTLDTSRMDKETLDAMLVAIEEYLPSFRAYLKKKAKMLGYEGGLPFYELFAPVGSANKHYSYEDAKDFIVENFNNFSKELGDYASKAFNESWVDVEPREGKVGGAFCSNIHAIKESRFLLNFTGNFDNVTTLAHELGHGYHGYNLKDSTYLNSSYPMPLAESASIFCETIVFNSALDGASKEEAVSILENYIMGATQVIVDIYSRYLFETKLFELRKNSSLSVDELKTAMLEAQREAYGDGLSDELHPYMWACKSHYYQANRNFYNFPYAFGLLFANGLYAKFLEDKESFPNQYNHILNATGCNSIHDVLGLLNIDSHSSDFFRSSLEVIKDKIDLFLSL